MTILKLQLFSEIETQAYICNPLNCSKKWKLKLKSSELRVITDMSDTVLSLYFILKFKYKAATNGEPRTWIDANK